MCRTLGWAWIGWFAAMSSAALAQPAATPSDVLKSLAEPAMPVVEAVYAFRRDCGLWPMALSDLVPDYLDAPPKDMTYHWNPEGDSVLFVSGSQRRAQLAHVFGGYDAGWQSWQDGHYVRIDLPMPDAGPERLSPEMLTRASREFDRRIAADPENVLHYQCKASLLYEGLALDEAAATASQWCQAFPADQTARVALLASERKRRSGLEIQAADEPWRNCPHATFADWSLYNEIFSDSASGQTMAEAVDLPFGVNDIEWQIADVTALTAVSSFLYSRPQKALEVCDRWKAESERLSQKLHLAYELARAAALLRCGKFDEAGKALARYKPIDDEDSAVEQGVRAAIAAKQQECDLNLTGLNPQGLWLLRPE